MRSLSYKFSIGDKVFVSNSSHSETDTPNTDFDLFVNNLFQLFKNRNKYINTPEYYNINIPGVSVESNLIKRQYPLTVGELFDYYDQSWFISHQCCGKVYIVFASGSLFSGANQYQGVCANCNTIVYGQLQSFRALFKLFINHSPRYQYSESPKSISDLLTLTLE